jgi:hypothetical protein
MPFLALRVGSVEETLTKGALPIERQRSIENHGHQVKRLVMLRKPSKSTDDLSSLLRSNRTRTPAERRDRGSDGHLGYQSF